MDLLSQKRTCNRKAPTAVVLYIIDFIILYMIYICMYVVFKQYCSYTFTEGSVYNYLFCLLLSSVLYSILFLFRRSPTKKGWKWTVLENLLLVAFLIAAALFSRTLSKIHVDMSFVSVWK